MSRIHSHRYARAAWRVATCVALLVCLSPVAFAVLPYSVELNKDAENGWELLVDGEQLPVNGVVWSFTPIGDDFIYNLWNEEDRFIRRMIDTDGPLLQAMGVRAVRVFTQIPPKWITYLYRRYGIYTIVNDLMGRYGVSVNGRWYPNTDYSMPETRELLLAQARETVEKFKDTPGVLFFIFGNENNYGLQWKSDAIEDLPVGERQQERARFLYSLFGEVTAASKEITDLPIGIVNGDTQYLTIIAEEASNIDIFGLNVYRGPRNEPIMFQSVATALDKPILYTEFGSDAFNATTQLEDQYNQARFLRSQWKEIYEQSYGKGNSQNIIGGLIFQWMDEWWKYGLQDDLFIHNTEGTWRQPAYYDSIGGENNMNEEWWGIVAQSPKTDKHGINLRVPRAAYYTMQDIWETSLYDIEGGQIDQYFAVVDIEGDVARSGERTLGDKIADYVKINGSLAVAGRGHFSDAIASEQSGAINFSHEEEATFEITVTPLHNLTLQTTFRAQAGFLDDALYDSYGYLITREDDSSEFSYIANDNTSYSRTPIEIYSAAFQYETDFIDINGYFHDGIDLPGHPDYYLQGDFFYLYPETFDREGIDLGLQKAPFGVEFETKGIAEGLTLFVGPEIFWGAEPALYFKFYRELFDGFYLGLIHYEAFQEEQFNSGLAVTPNRFPERKSSVYVQYDVPIDFVDLHIGLGGLIAGTEYLTAATLEESQYRSADGTTKTIGFADTLGGKVRLEALFNLTPVFNIYAEYIYAGVVASGRGFLPRGGSQITDGGASNRHEVIAGGNIWIGDLVISPKIRWRTPLEPAIVSGPNRSNGENSPRPVIDPVYVHGGNREILQGEIVLTYDFTGATWFHEWNNDDREDAVFAASLGLLYTFYQGPTDPLPELFLDSNFFGYGTWPAGHTREENLWSLQARVVSNFAPRSKIIATFQMGSDQNIGRPDTTPEMRYSGTVEFELHDFEIGLGLSHNAFGPEDWHFNQNIRAPWQWNALLAYHFGVLSLVEAKNRIGVEFRGRYLEGGTSESRTALNTLGSATDLYRMEVTLFYELSF